MEQKELAELTEISERTISELVNNKATRISNSTLEKIAEVLNINDMNELLELRRVDEV